MLMPRLFADDFFDDFFDMPKPRYTEYDVRKSDMMKTDIRETEGSYELTMNMPGVKKEDVKAELKDGYLTIQATQNSSRDEKDKEGRYIRRERYTGSCSRSFYVGEEVTQEDIRAKFEDGTLKLSIPKKEKKPAVEEKKYISIEG